MYGKYIHVSFVGIVVILYCASYGRLHCVVVICIYIYMILAAISLVYY